MIIGPERRADDPDVINYKCFVFQNVDVVSVAALARFSQGTADGVPIVVVVSENEHDRDCWSNPPFQELETVCEEARNVACAEADVGWRDVNVGCHIGLRDVHVTDDPCSHGGKLSGF